MAVMITILAIIGAITMLCLVLEIIAIVVGWIMTSGIWHDLRKWRKKQK